MRNSLISLPPESKIFIDANIFLYSILGHPKFKPNCCEFLLRIENGVYTALSSPLVLNEMVHKLMLAETIKTFQLGSEREALKLIKEQPDAISNMSLVWKNYTDIRKYPITVCSIDEGTMDMAITLSKKYGLLISDALHAATMNINGIVNIATADSHFEQIEGIKVWRP